MWSASLKLLLTCSLNWFCSESAEIQRNPNVVGVDTVPDCGRARTAEIDKILGYSTPLPPMARKARRSDPRFGSLSPLFRLDQ